MLVDSTGMMFQTPSVGNFTIRHTLVSRVGIGAEFLSSGNTVLVEDSWFTGIGRGPTTPVRFDGDGLHLDGFGSSQTLRRVIVADIGDDAIDHSNSTFTFEDAIIQDSGDSRIYRIRAGTLQPLTLDHSLWGELARAGTPQGPRGGSPYGNVITRALGAAASAPDVTTVDVAVGDVLVLCTDGLWEPVDDDALIATCTSARPAAACAALIAAALDGGGRDNITVIVAHVHAGRRA